MIKRISPTNYEYFTCSKCNEQVDEFDDICQICGHTFRKQTFSNLQDRFIALNFREIKISVDKKIIIAKLQNEQFGIKQFAIPEEMELAKKIKSNVINESFDFLGNSLMPDTLVKIEDFIKLPIKIDGNIENVLIHKSLI